jgi:hypothetical protein
MLRTDWFPTSIKPVRVGVYEVLVGSMNAYSYWDGKVFRSCAESVQFAIPTDRYRRKASDYMQEPTAMWRGLAEDPNVQP